MESGITASPELQSAFRTFLSANSQRGLLVTIENESLKPLKTVESSSASFKDDLANLTSYLKTDQALYVLLRGEDGAVAAVTYVPNEAPVRQKMLFASTQKALVKGLGAEHFSETFFATSAAELTEEGLKKHQAHTSAERPLTQEEKDQQDIRAAEAQEQGGTGRRGAGYGTTHGSSGVATNLGEGVEETIRKFAGESEEGGLVQLRINVPKEMIEVESVTNSISPDALQSTISSTEPRYSYYRHAYTDQATGSRTTAVVFIYTCPSSAKIKDRMLYASSRLSAVNLAERAVGLPLAKKFEASDPSDITAETIDVEFAPKKEEKTSFSKPKRPGRR